MPLIDGIIITLAGLNTLWPGHCLDGEVIYAWLQYLQLRSEDRLLALDVLFIRDLKIGERERAFQRFGGYNPFDYELLLLPHHLPPGDGHWILFAIYPQAGVIQCHDPVGNAYPDELQLLVEIMDVAARQCGQGARDWTAEAGTLRVGVDADSTNCGVCVCIIAQALITMAAVDSTSLDDYREFVFQVNLIKYNTNFIFNRIYFYYVTSVFGIGFYYRTAVNSEIIDLRV